MTSSPRRVHAGQRQLPPVHRPGDLWSEVRRTKAAGRPRRTNPSPTRPRRPRTKCQPVVRQGIGTRRTAAADLRHHDPQSSAEQRSQLLRQHHQHQAAEHSRRCRHRSKSVSTTRLGHIPRCTLHRRARARSPAHRVSGRSGSTAARRHARQRSPASATPHRSSRPATTSTACMQRASLARA